jgi:beta-lactamase regulating signal transducer with metallopeptidase domain
MTWPLTVDSSALASDWLQLLLEVSLKGIVVLTVTAAIIALVHRASAATRHLIWTIGVASLLSLPVLQVTLPGWRVPILPPLLRQRPLRDGLEKPSPELPGSYQNIKPARESLQAGSREETDLSWSAPDAKERVPADSAGASLIPEPTDASAVNDARGAGFASSARIGISPNWRLLLAVAWIAGSFAILGRIALAVARVRRIARGAEPVTDDHWTSLVDSLSTSLRLNGAPRLLRTRQLRMPVTCGIIHPTVLLPEDAEGWPPNWRRIVLLHEFSHIKRKDCLTQTLAQIACALHWFNPLAWSAARRLRIEREIACDDQVLEAGTRASDYASYLVEIASSFGPAALAPPVAVGMACSQLESRVRSILNPRVRRESVDPGRMWLTTLVAICFLIPLSILQPWSVASASLSASESAPSGSIAFDVSYQLGSESGRQTRTETATHELSQEASSERTERVTVAQSPHESFEQDRGEGGQEEDLRERGRVTAQSNQRPISTLESSRFDNQSDIESGHENAQKSSKAEDRSANVTSEDIAGPRMHQVLAEYLNSLRKMGFENVSARQASALHLHGVDEAFIAEVRGWGFEQVSLNELLRLKIAGVNSQYVSEMKRAGFENLSANRLAAMKIQGVNTEYVEGLRAEGFDKLSAEQLTGLRALGVTPAFIREAQSWGFGKLSLDELRSIRAVNITPAYAAEIRALGFQDVPLRTLIQLRVHSVDGRFVGEMRELGFNDAGIDDLVRAKIHGVTPEFVRRLRAAGFTNVSLVKMIEMKIGGIDEILLRNSR